MILAVSTSAHASCPKSIALLSRSGRSPFGDHNRYRDRESFIDEYDPLVGYSKRPPLTPPQPKLRSREMSDRLGLISPANYFRRQNLPQSPHSLSKIRNPLRCFDQTCQSHGRPTCATCVTLLIGCASSVTSSAGDGITITISSSLNLLCVLNLLDSFVEHAVSEQADRQRATAPTRDASLLARLLRLRLVVNCKLMILVCLFRCHFSSFRLRTKIARGHSHCWLNYLRLHLTN